ncbi:MAG: family 10 glycosylhydrolase [Armatimonadota bacterium]|nr:family 10 glycosylhydrolase [Armatimonadota bacterium]
MRSVGTAVGLLTLVGSITAGPSSAQHPQDVAQFRAYWVDSFGPGLYTEAQIEQLVAETRAANLNAIVAQVTRRADCLCNRSIMPRTEAEIDPYPFDPLQTLIEKAHAAGIEVHAWLNAGILWAGDTPPRDPDHVFHTHGPAAPDAENWVSRRYDGAVRGGTLYFFDPGHPAAADYIVEMYLSILRTYDVDGINLDFIRYPDFNAGENVPSWGYNPVALARFRALTGRRDVPAPTDPEWMAWRREQITGIVRRIYLEAYAVKPLVRISADTVTYGTISGEPGAWAQSRPYREVLQDWRGWMEEGILDLNIPMNYRRHQIPPPGQRSMYEEWNRFATDHQYARQAAIGTALYLNPVEDSVAQIRQALASRPDGRSAAGWVGFSYRTPDALVNQRQRSPEYARADLARALTVADPDPNRAPLFAAPVPVPPMPWKLAPATGHIYGAAATPNGPADQVLIELYDATGKLVASQRTNGRGWFGFVDLSPGGYSVAAGGVSTMITVSAGRVAPVSLVLRR